MLHLNSFPALAQYIIIYVFYFYKHWKRLEARDCEFLLHCTVPPLLTPFQVVPVMVGDAAQLSCLASRGDPPLNISWSYVAPQGLPPEPPPGLSVVTLSTVNSLLLIPQVTPDHRGIYKCEASNLVGHDQHLMELIVNGMFRFSCFLIRTRRAFWLLLTSREIREFLDIVITYYLQVLF